MAQKEDIFDRVLFIGPDMKGNGGISTVLGQYAAAIRPFHYLRTNSRKGTVRGLLNLALTVLRLPVERIRGRRILHIHYASGKSWIRKKVLAKFGRALGFKTVMHCHCNIVRLADRHGKKAVAAELSRSARNLVLAKVYDNFLTDTLNLKNTAVVVNPMALDARSAHPGTGPVVFLFMGLLNREKGVYDLVEAARRLFGDGFDFRIIMAGTGDIDELKKIAAAYGIADKISFPGWVGGDEKTQLFGQSHVLVLPSYTEGMPMSILEAKCAGMPVISTRVGAIPEIVRNGTDGLVISAGNVEELADAMKTYLLDTDIIESHGRESLLSSQRFSVNEVKKELSLIYTTILN